MSIDTAVDGDPASCRRTARKLRDLHDQLAEARAYLDGQAHLAAAHFDGMSGDAYRARCAAVGRAVDAAADSSRGLARALDGHADGLDEVLGVMAAAREVARRELVLHGHTIPTPGGYATDRQRQVYRALAATVDEARREEDRLREAWLTAIARHAVGPVDDLCLPAVMPTVLPGLVVSRPVAGAPRTSTTEAVATVAATETVDTTETVAATVAATVASVAPPDSVWVPWGGGDAA